jgi:capsular exopolysaccharide synthesis family protein
MSQSLKPIVGTTVDRLEATDGVVGGAEDLSLPSAWNALRRHRLLLLGALLAVVVPMGVYVSVATPVYEALTSIRIDEQQQSSLPGLLNAMSGGSSDVGTEMAVLASQSLADDVTDLLHLQLRVAEPSGVPRDSLLRGLQVARDAPATSYSVERRRDGRFLITDQTTGAHLDTVEIGQPVRLPGVRFTLTPRDSRLSRLVINVAAFEDAADLLATTLSVGQPQRDANIVAVKYRDTDPFLSRDVANTIGQRFIERRQDIQKTESRSTAVFLREQIDTLSSQLARSEEALRRFREREHVVSPEVEANTQVARLVQTQADRRSIEAERAAFSQLLTEVSRSADQAAPDRPSPYRRLLAFPTLLKNDLASDILQMLNQTERDRAELLTRRTANDPDVKELTGRIHDLEKQLRVTAETYLEGLTNQVGSLDTALQKFGQQLATIPAKEVQFARLQREPKVLEDIYTLLQSRLKEAEIAQAVQDPSVRIVDVARLPTLPVEPRPVLYMLGAGIAGLMLGVMGVFMRESMDGAIHSSADVQSAAGLSVIGYIPRIRAMEERATLMASRSDRSRWRRRKLARQHRGILGGGASPVEVLNGQRILRVDLPDLGDAVLEAYSMLLTNIAFARVDTPMRALVFTSPLVGDGKTTSACNLAITLAQRGQQVLLVDADLRRGAINRLFGDTPEPGFTDILLGRATFEESRRTVDLGDHHELHFIPTGPHTSNPGTILRSETMRQFMDQAREEYTTIVIDSPPVNVVSDAALIGGHADGVIVVARVGVTEAEALGHAIQMLRHLRAPVIGALLNDIDFKREAAYDSAYRYYNYDAYLSPTSAR